VSALGGTPRFDRASLIPQAAEALAAEEDERGRRVVVVLDEAHMVDADQLEGVRLLSKRRTRQPLALRVCARRSAEAAQAQAQAHPPRRLRGLDQRVALRCSMSGMDTAETASYVAHHLKIAGRSDSLFQDDAVAVALIRSRGACPGR
jgi:type II secretory pathway predicted ATPase ExeA